MEKTKIKHSYVAYILRFITDIMFYSILLIGIIMFGLTLFLNGSISNNSWPVSIDGSKQFEYSGQIKVADPELYEVHGLAYEDAILFPVELGSSGSVSLNQGEINFFPDQWEYYEIFLTCFKFLYLMICLCITHQLRKFFLTIETSSQIVTKNYHRIRSVSLLLLFLFVYQVLYSKLNHWFIIENVNLIKGEFISGLWSPFSFGTTEDSLQAHQILLHSKESTWLLFISGCVYLFALIYREALNLKSDNESIV